MFAKLSALVLVLPAVVSALTLYTPTHVTSGGETTFVWTTEAGDPSTFNLELDNPQLHNTFALANNVQSNLHSITVKIPTVPAGNDYVAEAVATNNVNVIYATSGEFAISQA